MDSDNTQDKKETTCGCDCAACMRGDHEHCETGLCKWHKTDEADDEDE